MPKVVDHEQRRRDIGVALMRVVQRDGMAAASVRTVAAEAGWSTGALRYYFKTQEELREFATRLAGERVEHRILEYVRYDGAHVSLTERAATIAEQLIPLDDERREEYRLWQAVAEWSRHGERADAAQIWEQQRDLYRQIVFRMSGNPDEPLPPVSKLSPEVETWAEYLHVFVDGLAAQAMFVPDDMPPERVRAVLRSFLAEISETAGSAPARNDGGLTSDARTV